MKKGRKSAEELGISVIDVQRQRLTPPEFLNERETAIFRSIVDNCDPATLPQGRAAVAREEAERRRVRTSPSLARFHQACGSAGIAIAPRALHSTR